MFRKMGDRVGSEYLELEFVGEVLGRYFYRVVVPPRSGEEYETLRVGIAKVHIGYGYITVMRPDGVDMWIGTRENDQRLLQTDSPEVFEEMVVEYNEHRRLQEECKLRHTFEDNISVIRDKTNKQVTVEVPEGYRVCTRISHSSEESCVESE